MDTFNNLPESKGGRGKTCIFIFNFEVFNNLVVHCRIKAHIKDVLWSKEQEFSRSVATELPKE